MHIFMQGSENQRFECAFCPIVSKIVVKYSALKDAFQVLLTLVYRNAFFQLTVNSDFRKLLMKLKWRFYVGIAITSQLVIVLLT